MTPAVTPSALDVDLDHRRRVIAAGVRPHVHAEHAQHEVAKAAAAELMVVPAVIDVDYWEEGEGWVASAPQLGVSAVADSEAGLFGEVSEAIDEYWDILNADYATLSDAMRGLLSLRYQPLKLNRRS